MKNVKRLALAAIMMVSGASVMTAQDKVEATVAADVVNDYIWRGTDCGDAAFQPTLGLSYKGLSLTGWGSVGIVNSDDTKEFDLTLAYSTGGFNIGITDRCYCQHKCTSGFYFHHITNSFLV